MLKTSLKYLLVLLMSAGGLCCMAQPAYKIDYLIWKDDFTRLSSSWLVEADPSTTAVIAKDGKLVIDAKEGVSVWLNRKLEGNLLLECDRRVIMQGGKNDRLSDFNFFWMATDSVNANLFTRKGVFKEYDTLQLYYAGIGGNTNTTSRFRRYHHSGSKDILQEYTDTSHLLQANKTYHVRILIQNGSTAIWLDDQLYFFYQDPHPLQTGYFAIRTTKSRQEISNFKIYRLK